MLEKELDRLIAQALAEDLGETGDLTSNATIGENAKTTATVFAGQSGVVAGLNVARRVFHHVDGEILFEARVEDGASVSGGDKVVSLQGRTRGILTAERTALNFLQRLSGIATLTAEFVRLVRGTKAVILDTRKTTPGLRMLEKEAVRVGGGQNHRMGLYDMILLKENHIRAAGGIAAAVVRAREHLRSTGRECLIEVEVRNPGELSEALTCDVDRIMLDNMSLANIREAVALTAGRTKLEVSGGVNAGRVAEIAATGVDYISVGALTHSAKALDLSLLLDNE